MADSKNTKSKASDDEALEEPDELIINDATKDDLDSPSTEKEGTDVGNGMPSDGDLGQAMNEAEEEAAQPADKPRPKAKRAWSRKKIILVISGVVAAIIALLFMIPATRYAIVGVLVKRDVTVTLHDSKTNKPVSNVAVQLDGKTATTDAKGLATLRSVAVGSKKLTASKKYYKNLSSDILVPITGANPTFQVDIQATGRQVPVKVVNKISKQPLEGVQVSVDDTSSKTDKNGEAVMVLPADKSEIDAVVSGNGYNNLPVKITVTDQLEDKNTFALTPSGKLYFLSKRSGTIDVLKADLDGGNVETVLKGTGKEEEYGTVLLASRDWKYLALKARRDSDQPKLYLIETNNSKLSVIDEGDVEFSLVGWHNSHFMYTLNRTKLKNWEPKHYALKSFNATSGSLGILDETGGSGSDDYHYVYERLDNVYILNNELVYSKEWSSSLYPMLSGKTMTVNSVRPDGSNKRVVKSFPQEENGYYIGTARLYKPQEVYFEVYQKSQRSFWEYEDDKLSEAKDINGDSYYTKFYPTFLLSPSSKATFWYEPRDGKNTLFLGNANGDEGKEIATLSEYTPYGWYGDGYLLVSKGGSELFVMARDRPDATLKVTDYHRPRVDFSGYGYGYGGF